jgi:hypothetical protein
MLQQTERAWSFPESVLHNHRHRLLYEAAQSMLRSKKWSWLKAWAMLCAWLFLWEIYSPDYGFRMPWLQVEASPSFAPLLNAEP